MKKHYGEKFVPRIAYKKKAARTREERKDLQDLIRIGRRMERRTSRLALRKGIHEEN